MTQSLLALSDLHVTFSTRRGLVEAVRGVTLSLGEGEMLGLVGESGSGKSVTGFAITRLLDAAGRITAGRIRFRGQDITRISASDFRHLHGAAMAMIFQNPRAALNPIRAVGDQIADAITAHKRMPRDEARAQALELLRAVQIRDPEKRMAAYPHELSGGMCQRVMIALALAARPVVLIADEPTTGLDATIQSRVLDLLEEMKAELKTTTIVITHDMGVARRLADRVAVMYAGRVVEEGRAQDVLSGTHAVKHPYTHSLLYAIPSAGDIRAKRRLPVIEGDVPDLSRLPAGCQFAARCSMKPAGREAQCDEREPELLAPLPGHRVRCWLHPAPDAQAGAR
jgi:peptide/nickel transport system ATP-binding protein